MRFRARVASSAAVLSAAILLAAALPGMAAQHSHGQQKASKPPSVIYVCPMDPEVESTRPGSCPKCGMTLVRQELPPIGGTAAAPVAKAPSKPYLVEVTTTPAAPKAGTPTEIKLTVRNPVTKATVKRMAVVHEERYHLFVLSEDLDHYDHVHPTPQADGSFAVTVTLPATGHYTLLSDFLPVGGRAQVIASRIATEGAPAEPTRAHLVPDTNLSQSVGGMTLALTLPAGGLVAGKPQTFTYRVTDAASGAPVTDLQPYLGAYGHTLVMSEDLRQHVHVHPSEEVPANRALAKGGPTLTLRGTFPESGNYRIWTQVKRNDVVSLSVFTVAVGAPVAPTGAAAKN